MSYHATEYEWDEVMKTDQIQNVPEPYIKSAARYMGCYGIDECCVGCAVHGCDNDPMDISCPRREEITKSESCLTLETEQWMYDDNYWIRGDISVAMYILREAWEEGDMFQNGTLLRMKDNSKGRSIIDQIFF